MDQPTPSAKDSPYLEQLKAREKFYVDKIEHSIPKFSDRQDEALERAKSHLAQVRELIRDETKAQEATK